MISSFRFASWQLGFNLFQMLCMTIKKCEETVIQEVLGYIIKCFAYLFLKFDKNEFRKVFCYFYRLLLTILYFAISSYDKYDIIISKTVSGSSVMFIFYILLLIVFRFSLKTKDSFSKTDFVHSSFLLKFQKSL